MANKRQLSLLKKDIESWNSWRKTKPNIPIDLSRVDLSGFKLSSGELNQIGSVRAFLIEASINGANLSEANLSEANLSEANLSGANLIGANLSGANLSGANLTLANLIGANLSGANLSGADLILTNFIYTDLSRTDLSNASMETTNFTGIDLRTTKGLETVTGSWGPSDISISTLERSKGEIPEAFLREVGLSETLITYARSLTQSAVEYYTCFISYSNKNQEFAERLYTDLQRNGVRCWFAPEDLKIGEKFRARIDESIKVYDKLLLVLSEHALTSSWVEVEVEAAFIKEEITKRTVLFPIRLDTAIINSTTAWAAHIQRTRHIGDFEHWKKDHDAYMKAFHRLLRDLKTSTTKESH